MLGGAGWPEAPRGNLPAEHTEVQGEAPYLGPLLPESRTRLS